MPLGLSSLGRCEGHVLADPRRGDRLARSGSPTPAPSTHRPCIRGRPRSLAATGSCVGTPTPCSEPPSAGRDVRIMVTLPTEAREYRLRARHGRARSRRPPDQLRPRRAPTTGRRWRATPDAPRARPGARCRVLVDLEGPRARTGRVAARAASDVRVARGRPLSAWSPAPPTSARRPAQVECSLPEAIATAPDRPPRLHRRGPHPPRLRGGRARPRRCSASPASSRRGGSAATRASTSPIRRSSSTRSPPRTSSTSRRSPARRHRRLLVRAERRRTSPTSSRSSHALAPGRGRSRSPPRSRRRSPSATCPRSSSRARARSRSRS